MVPWDHFSDGLIRWTCRFAEQRDGHDCGGERGRRDEVGFGTDRDR